MSVELRWLPNLITFVRIALILPFAMALANGSYGLALLLFFVAGLSDGVDGYLARHFGWFSRLGAIADPLADKLLLVTAYLMLTLQGVLPFWLFMLVLGRDLVILAGAILFHIFVGRYEIQPSLLGKANTFVQIFYALALITHLAGVAFPPALMTWGLWLVALMAVLSGGHYVIRWGSRAWRRRFS